MHFSRSSTVLLGSLVLGLGLLAGCEESPQTTPPPAPAPKASTTTGGEATKPAAPAAAPASTPAPSTPAAPASGEGILIGHYGSLTGSEATFGQSTSNGIRLAIKEFNLAGGLNGKPIQLKEYDTKGDPNEATLAVTRLVKSDRVVAVLGEVASKLSLAAAPVCQEAGVPMISPSSTNPRVTAVGDMIFRVCFIDPFQGFAGAKFAHENLKAKNAAVLVDQAQAYAVGLADEFKANFQKMGGTIATEQKYTGGAQDFTAQLTSIRSAKPEVIYIPGYYTDVGNIALQARKLGITAPLLGGDGWDSEELAKIAKNAIEGCYYTNHYAPDQAESRVQEFIKKYKAEYNGSTPDGLAALGYDAAKILFDSMKRAKSLGGKDLRDAIGSTKGFAGVTGDISLNANRDAVKSAVVVEMAGDPPTPKYVTTVKPN